MTVTSPQKQESQVAACNGRHRNSTFRVGNEETLHTGVWSSKYSDLIKRDAYNVLT